MQSVFVLHTTYTNMYVKASVSVLLVSWIGLVSAQRGNSTRAAGRIIGGVATRIVQFPHQVSLQYHDDFHYCGGSIISNKWILTAAHCVYDLEKISDKVVAATTKLTRPRKVRVFREVIVHAAYNPSTYDNDIALKRIRKLGVNRRRRDSIDLPPRAAVKLNVEPGTPVVATGWGVTDDGDDDPANRLQMVTVEVVDHNDCTDNYPDEDITAGMLCAAAPGKDTCQGDSGGPLIRKGNATTNAMLFGVTSWGYGCAVNGLPRVYASVPHYREWIFENTGV